MGRSALGLRHELQDAFGFWARLVFVGCVAAAGLLELGLRYGIEGFYPGLALLLCGAFGTMLLATLYIDLRRAQESR